MKPFPATSATPRTDSLIAKVMEQHPTEHLRTDSSIKRVLAKYFEAVHQELAPLCRELELENLALRDRLCNPTLKAGIETNSRASANAAPIEGAP